MFVEEEGGERRMVELKSVTINDKEQIFLDGKEIENVVAYKLENSAESGGPAKLMVEMLVTVGRVAFES